MGVKARHHTSNEIYCGRIAGPFLTKPISNLRCLHIGIVPKKTCGFKLITHLSFPTNFSVNDYADEKFTSVKYSSFDNAINMIKNLGVNALVPLNDYTLYQNYSLSFGNLVYYFHQQIKSHLDNDLYFFILIPS
jgi:hypothetical protein